MVDSVAEHISALDDEDWGVREDAAVALGRLGDPRGVQPLIRTLRDSDRAVREAATAALKALGEPAILSLGFCLQDLNPQVQESAACILADIANEQVLDPLLSAALSPNWIVRMSAAKGLSRIQNSLAIDTLILLLQDKVPAVREEAGRAIQAIGNTSIPKLLEKLKDQNWKIRLRAVEALTLLKPLEAVGHLMILVLEDSDTAVRQDAVRALGQIGDPRAIPLLLSSLALETPSLKLPSIEALGQLRSTEAIPMLIALVNSLPKEAYEDRMEGCTDPQYKKDLPPLEAAIRALGKIRDPQAVPALIQALQSTLLRTEAAEALTQFGQTAVNPLLKLLKTTKNDNLRRHVLESLSHLGWRPGQIRI
ncbi:MAG: HEAT repeat domain-containing protein [Nitrospiraceae bacterium]|nr:HEAT repeat domain-containing protein [Nitrospira sp.]MCB9774401.1 HEAT repeat domain-containing protein [Nitrospiraceae bacterium]